MADTLHELTAAYALDALDDHETREYEEHLRRCEQCRADLRSLQEAATLLAYAPEPVQPPAALRARIVEIARTERPKVVRIRPRWAYPVAAAAAVAAIAAIGLGIWAATLSSSLDRERGRAALVKPGSQVVSLKGTAGTLVIARSGKAALILPNLEPAGPGRVYEAWVIPKAAKPTPLPAGLFKGGVSQVVPLTLRVPAGATVAVTKEAAGGSAAPHPPLLITAQSS
jgi:anti-sigma-K factor RskA